METHDAPATPTSPVAGSAATMLQVLKAIWRGAKARRKEAASSVSRRCIFKILLSKPENQYIDHLDAWCRRGFKSGNSLQFCLTASELLIGKQHERRIHTLPGASCEFGQTIAGFLRDGMK